MADSKELRMNVGDYTGANEINALMFLINSVVSRRVNTAIPVVVTSVERSGKGKGAGYLSCKPLVMQMSASGESLPNTEIPRVPYFRYQHGSCAVVCDPKVGDVGLAVFAQQDCSNLSGGTDQKPAGSFRTFDMSDGFYIGGFWGKAPTTFVHLEDSGEVAVEATTKVTLKAPTIESQSDVFTVNSAQINLNGAISGGGSGGASATFSGSLHADQDVTSGNISLQGHTHKGDSGGTTGAPQ